MKYIIQVGPIYLLTENIENARELFNALLNTKIVDTDYKYQDETFLIRPNWSLNIREVNEDRIRDLIHVSYPVDEDAIDPENATNQNL